jgi:hypothetical protein
MAGRDSLGGELLLPVRFKEAFKRKLQRQAVTSGSYSHLAIQ